MYHRMTIATAEYYKIREMFAVFVKGDVIIYLFEKAPGQKKNIYIYIYIISDNNEDSKRNFKN